MREMRYSSRECERAKSPETNQFYTCGVESPKTGVAHATAELKGMLSEECLGGNEDARRGGRSTAEVMRNERTNRDRVPETPRADILHREVTQFLGFIVRVYDTDRSKGIL
jgi:hypothetical protein